MAVSRGVLCLPYRLKLFAAFDVNASGSHFLYRIAAVYIYIDGIYVRPFARVGVDCSSLDHDV